MVKKQDPKYQFIIRLLQNHSIRYGSVLVIGNEPESVAHLLEKLGFEVQCLTLGSLRNKSQDSEEDLNSFTRIYDIILLDDILPYLESPYAIIRSIKNKLARGGDERQLEFRYNDN